VVLPGLVLGLEALEAQEQRQPALVVEVAWELDASSRPPSDLVVRYLRPHPNQPLLQKELAAPVLAQVA